MRPAPFAGRVLPLRHILAPRQAHGLACRDAILDRRGERTYPVFSGQPTFFTDQRSIVRKLESLIVLKWSTGKFPNPAPLHVKLFWSCLATALVVYPLARFGLPWTSASPTSKGAKRSSGRSTPVLRESLGNGTSLGEAGVSVVLNGVLGRLADTRSVNGLPENRKGR